MATGPTPCTTSPAHPVRTPSTEASQSGPRRSSQRLGTRAIVITGPAPSARLRREVLDEHIASDPITQRCGRLILYYTNIASPPSPPRPSPTTPLLIREPPV